MIKDYFPFDSIRETQDRVLTQLDIILPQHSCIILESPVGSGKSAMALAVGCSRGRSFLLTPRKSLQDQYFDDFSQHVVTLKGRSAYPCVDPSRPGNENLPVHQIESEVFEGNLSTRFLTGRMCATGRCTTFSTAARREAYVDDCESSSGIACPYNSAIQVAIGAPHVVCNLHSFIFQTNFAGRFERRPTLIVDECHDMAGIVRDMLEKDFYIRGIFINEDSEMEQWDLPRWQRFFHAPQNRPIGSNTREFRDYLEDHDLKVEALAESIFGAFVVDFKVLPGGTVIKFRQLNVAAASRKLILDHGDKILLMSGTIYNKNMFCWENGLDARETAHVKVNSTFPVANRPVILHPNAIDTSARVWENNFGHLVDVCREIMDDHPREKGLIHVSSYAKAIQLQAALGDRAVTHTPEDFQLALMGFFIAPGNGVFISPICQQGTDFKDDRARFQIVTSVPYLNVGDKVVKRMMETVRGWYDLKTLVVFGQILGRVVRSETDSGTTYLVDSRFRSFINRTRRHLPRWLTESFIGL